MAQNLSQAPSQDWKNNTGEDFLHLKNSRGSIVGGIDNAGSGFGTMQGGFIPPATKSLYVDGNRTDSYTADGSLLKPFKTIMAAVNQVISNGDNSLAVPYLIDIVGPGSYAESIILENASLVSLTFEGHGVVTVTGTPSVGPGPLRSQANNSNLQLVQFSRMFLVSNNGINGTVVLSGSGNFLSGAGITGLYFYQCKVQTFSWTQTGTGGSPSTTTGFFNSEFNSTATFTNVQGIIFVGVGPSSNSVDTGASISLVGTFMAVENAAYVGISSTISIDATSELDVIIGSRCDATLTVNGLLRNKASYIFGGITVNSGGTYQEDGGSHQGALTINAGGAYTLLATTGVGAIAVGAAAPVVQAGQVGIGSGTSTTATAGAQTLPANPAGFWVVNIAGTTQKIPYYNN